MAAMVWPALGLAVWRPSRRRTRAAPAADCPAGHAPATSAQAATRALPDNVTTQMDLALWAHNHDRPAAELAVALNMTVERAQGIYADIEAKRRATQYLHRTPVLVEEVPEIRY